MNDRLTFKDILFTIICAPLLVLLALLWFIHDKFPDSKHAKRIYITYFNFIDAIAEWVGI